MTPTCISIEAKATLKAGRSCMTADFSVDLLLGIVVGLLLAIMIIEIKDWKESRRKAGKS